MLFNVHLLLTRSFLLFSLFSHLFQSFSTCTFSPSSLLKPLTSSSTPQLSQSRLMQALVTLLHRVFFTKSSTLVIFSHKPPESFFFKYGFTASIISIALVHLSHKHCRNFLFPDRRIWWGLFLLKVVKEMSVLL